MIDTNTESATCLLDTDDEQSTDRSSSSLEELGIGAGNGCSECGMPGEDLENSWCQHCGYFAKYGTTVDLDVVEASSEPAEFPKWIKTAGIIAGVAFLGSIGARFALSSFPTVHMIFGTTQLILGFAVFMALHAIGFLQLALTDGGVKLMDLMNPYAIWAPVIAEMPDTEKRVLAAWAGVCIGFTALVTGGQPTSWLEFKETVIITEEEPEEEGDGGMSGPQGAGDLESAVKDFAKKGTRGVHMPGDQVGAGAVGEAPDTTETLAPEPEEEEEWLDAECVIIGYLPQAVAPISDADSSEPEDVSDAGEDVDEREAVDDDASGEPTDENVVPELPGIRALVVASQVGHTLCVVGYVSEGVTPEVASDLLRQFEGNHRDTPFVRCEVDAVWLKPKFVCNIQYKLWDPKAGLLEPKFDKVLQVLP